MPSKITLLYIMPAPHAGMPLFTTRYALIPSIILCVTGGIRPYAPRHPSLTVAQALCPPSSQPHCCPSAWELFPILPFFRRRGRACAVILSRSESGRPYKYIKGPSLAQPPPLHGRPLLM
eukprot:COSAG06_NODE_9286_length_1938_cov_5.182164_1_plen_119_part_10